MHDTKLSRRNFLANATMGSLAACALPAFSASAARSSATEPDATGGQRLSLEDLKI